MNPVNAVRTLLLAGCLTVLAWTACPGPQPIPSPPGPPAPGPQPVADAAVLDVPLPLPLFDHKVFDCHQDAVKAVYQAAKPDVKKCLVQASASSCLVDLATQGDPATVACLARDLGADANAAVLAGSTDPGDAVAAAAARDFINSQVIGYR